MNIGEHIPCYILLERFSKRSRIVALYPPDECGFEILLEPSESLISVTQSAAQSDDPKPLKLERVIATIDQLPLKKNGFDLVIGYAMNEFATESKLDAFLKASRSLVNVNGIMALLVPNRDARWIETSGSKTLPGFFELERTMRRHFPHVNFFAQRPLNGAVLTPIGRRKSVDAPFLEDRLLPDDGEPPSHFLVVASQRYQKVFDATMVQVPFTLMADRISDAVEKLNDRLYVTRTESESKSREIDQLLGQLDRLKDDLQRSQQVKHDHNRIAQELEDTQRQLGLRTQALKEAETAHRALSENLNETEADLHEQRAKILKQERRIQEAQQLEQFANTERNELEDELKKAVQTVRTTQADLKAKQRELDDHREQIAGLENDMDALGRESLRQRQELQATRERNRALEIELKEIQDRFAATSAVENDIERYRQEWANERTHLERRLGEEHQRLMAEHDAKERQATYAGELERQVEQLLNDTKKKDRRIADLESIVSQSDSDQESLAKQRRNAEKATEDYAKLAQERADKVSRQRHQIDVLMERTEHAERNNSTLKKQLDDLHNAFEETEKELRNLKHVNELESQQHAENLELTHHSQQKFRVEIQKLSQELRSAEETRTVLESELKSLSGDLEIKVKANEELTGDRDRLTQTVADLESQLEEMRNAPIAMGTSGDIDQIEFDLSKAVSNLAADGESPAVDGANTNDVDTYRMRIQELERTVADLEEEKKALEKRVKRLSEDVDSELLKVKKDLETELKTVTYQYEARQGEVWELRDEIVRLQAQVAASASAAEQDGRDVDFKRALTEQETMIAELKEERDALRTTCERQRSSLEIRKKNLRLVAALLRKERSQKQTSTGQASAPADPNGDEPNLELPPSLRESKVDSLLFDLDDQLSSGKEETAFSLTSQPPPFESLIDSTESKPPSKSSKPPAAGPAKEKQPAAPTPSTEPPSPESQPATGLAPTAKTDNALQPASRSNGAKVSKNPPAPGPLQPSSTLHKKGSTLTQGRPTGIFGPKTTKTTKTTKEKKPAVSPKVKRALQLDKMFQSPLSKKRTDPKETT